MALVLAPTISSSLSVSPTKLAPNLPPSSVSSLDHITTLLKSCSNIRDFSPIHAQLITTDLIHDPQVADQVFTFLASTNNVEQAHQICNYTHQPHPTIWNTLLENLLKCGSIEGVFETYCNMVTKGVSFDISTFHYLIHACCVTLDVRVGSEVHGRLFKFGFGSNRSLNNNLMGFYSKCGKLEEVSKLFEKLRHRNVVTWNTMISCYVSQGMYREALSLFDRMIVDGVVPDEITMVSLISACSKLRDLGIGKALHRYAEDNNLLVSGSLLNCLVDMYVKCGEMEEANRLLRKCRESKVDVVLLTTFVSGFVKSNKIDDARRLFDLMAERSLLSWTTMMSGYARNGSYSEVIELFRQMLFDNVSPDEVVVVTTLSACSHMEDFELGRALHGLVFRLGLVVDGFLGNALMDFYAKCGKTKDAYSIFGSLPSKNIVSWNSMLDGFCRNGDTEKARGFFDSIPEKDVVSWNTMVNFYVKQNLFKESFELFHEMQSSVVKPDKITLISLLSSCANVGALNHGIWIHVYIEKHEIGLDTMLVTALLDMYGKCGRADIAYELFSKITDKNVHVWTAMISAYAMEGHAYKAIDLFQEMEESGIRPDYVTFIALLSASSHGGLVEEGYKHFDKMRNFYGITPTIQHYGCMVDLLGRTGRVEEAMKFIERMPIEADASVWSSMLRACESHNNVELAELAFEHLIEIDPKNDGAYVLLSKIYANAGRWDGVSNMRTKLHDMGIRKKPGLSVIEKNGVVHEFTCGDFSNPDSEKIHSMLEEIETRLQKPELSLTSSHHNERLAVAFGLIIIQGKSTIRVVNNLRICGDCHSFMEFISESYDREIVIRENYRFHRFKHGHCSCNGYW